MENLSELQNPLLDKNTKHMVNGYGGDVPNNQYQENIINYFSGSGDVASANKIANGTVANAGNYNTNGRIKTQQLLDATSLHLAVEAFYRPNFILYKEDSGSIKAKEYKSECCETTFTEKKSKEASTPAGGDTAGAEDPQNKLSEDGEHVKIQTVSYEVEEEEYVEYEVRGDMGLVGDFVLMKLASSFSLSLPLLIALHLSHTYTSLLSLFLFTLRIKHASSLPVVAVRSSRQARAEGRQYSQGLIMLFTAAEADSNMAPLSFSRTRTRTHMHTLHLLHFLLLHNNDTNKKNQREGERERLVHRRRRGLTVTSETSTTTSVPVTIATLRNILEAGESPLPGSFLAQLHRDLDDDSGLGTFGIFQEEERHRRNHLGQEMACSKQWSGFVAEDKNQTEICSSGKSVR
ncbi:hypothetical protein WMY93_008153 [Mugilogobius chulae]|uniref:Uncharacterized protein n=1 Tax=Mugilogobius chulae TaxID=88201 RepID=A0AAW0PP45_9GOBI